MGWTRQDDSARRLTVILIAALATRLVTFGNPIVHVDEQFYFVTARAWLDGALPYVDIWDRKPVGLFLLYLPAAALGLPLGIWAYQLMALAALVATALIIMALADRAGWRRGALAGAVAYVIWVGLVEGQGGQAPIFYNLPMAAAALLVAPRGTAIATRAMPDWLGGTLAMALVGIALQLKYSAVFEGVFFGLWLLWRARSEGKRGSIVPLGLLFCATALLPTVIAALAFHGIGAGGDWFYANFASIGARRADPWGEQLGNLAGIVAILSPLVAAAILAHRQGGDAMHGAVRHWLFAWLLAALFGLLVFGSWFDHYALPALLPASICAAGFFGDHRAGRRIVVPLLFVAFLGAQGLILMKRHNRGTPAQFAALTGAIGQGPGCLYVYSGETMLYPATGRCRLSRYIFPSHLGRIREHGAIGVDQAAEVTRILSRAPTIVVMRPAYRGERPEIRALVTREMNAHYRLRAVRPLGSKAIRVFERR